MKHWLCAEQITGEEFLVCADTWGEACDIAEEVGAEFIVDPDIFVDPKPLTEDEAENTGLDEY